MNHKLDLERLNTRVKREEKEWLIEYMYETRSRSLGEALGRLIEENKTLKNEQSQVDSLRLLHKQYAELKEIHFQTSMITEILNHMVNALGIDDIEEQVVLTTFIKTGVFSAAEKLIHEKSRE